MPRLVYKIYWSIHKIVAGGMTKVEVASAKTTCQCCSGNHGDDHKKFTDQQNSIQTDKSCHSCNKTTTDVKSCCADKQDSHCPSAPCNNNSACGGGSHSSSSQTGNDILHHHNLNNGNSGDIKDKSCCENNNESHSHHSHRHSDKKGGFWSKLFWKTLCSCFTSSSSSSSATAPEPLSSKSEEEEESGCCDCHGDVKKKGKGVTSSTTKILSSAEVTADDNREDEQEDETATEKIKTNNDASSRSSSFHSKNQSDLNTVAASLITQVNSASSMATTNSLTSHNREEFYSSSKPLLTSATTNDGNGTGAKIGVAIGNTTGPPLLSQKFLLPPQSVSDAGKKLLVLDLDETLVHSSFEKKTADLVLPIKIGLAVHDVYVNVRPGTDEFLREMGKHYEIAIFTASLNNYADPVIDAIDSDRNVKYRLFRESCVLYRGTYIKDLGLLGRPLTDIIIIDNMPGSYCLHPQNAIAITSWFADYNDKELTQLIPWLKQLSKVKDVTTALWSKV